jgi:hypothetical protein
MRTSFVPPDFNIPAKTALGTDYYLIPINTNNLMEDWQIIINNADSIIKTRGGGSRKEWPYTCTLEEDYKDLAWLQICADYRQLFSYIIRSVKDNSYIGCIYIYPTELFYPDKGKDYDVDFSFWIIRSELDKGIYGQMAKKLMEWLRDSWPFDKNRIYFRNKLVPEEIKSLLK